MKVRREFLGGGGGRQSCLEEQLEWDSRQGSLSFHSSWLGGCSIVHLFYALFCIRFLNNKRVKEKTTPFEHEREATIVGISIPPPPLPWDSE